MDGIDPTQWPPLDRRILLEDRPPTPPFDDSFVPPNCRDFCYRLAGDCGAPIDFVFAGLLLAASAAAGNSVRPQPWHGWEEAPQCAGR